MRLCMPSLPRMPPKGTLRKLSQSFMIDREHELGKLLAAMLRSDPELHSPELRSFLDLPPFEAAPSLLEQLRSRSLEKVKEDVCPSCGSCYAPVAQNCGKCGRPRDTFEDPFDSPHMSLASGQLANTPEALEVVGLSCHTYLDCESSATPASNPQDAASLQHEAINVSETLDTVTVVAASRPDFNGSWVLMRVEGDMESLMKELGLPWVARKAAAAAGYGVGKAKAQIKQTDDRIELETITPMKTFNRIFTTDGLEHDEELDGRSLKTIVRWDDSTLVVDARDAKSSKVFPTTRRYMSGADMVVQQTLHDGKVVRQHFVTDA